jgi:DNA-binding NarL/FixJ family response regulator
VLLVVAHPAVGSGIETLLRLERRYAVRRVTRLGEAIAVARAWPADAAVIDAAMLRSDPVSLGVPTLVLAGTEGESAHAARVLDQPRGAIAKDPAGADLARAVETLFTGGHEPNAGPYALAAIGVLTLVLLALFLYLIWLAIV